jgi:hypothetical protein
MSDRWGRWASLTGALFTVLLIAGIFSGSETPEPNATPLKVVAYYAAHISSVESSAVLLAFAVLVLVLWGAALTSFFRRTPAARGPELLILPGAVLLAAGGLTVAGLEFGTAHYLHDLSAETVRTLNVLSDIIFLPLIAGGFLFAFGSGLAILRGAALPKWLGWVAVVIGIAALVPPASFPALLAFAIWSLVASVLVFVRLGRSELSASAVPQPAT